MLMCKARLPLLNSNRKGMCFETERYALRVEKSPKSKDSALEDWWSRGDEGLGGLEQDNFWALNYIIKDESTMGQICQDGYR